MKLFARGIGVVSFVLLLTYVYHSGGRDHLPSFLLTAELRLHQVLTSLNPRPPHVKWLLLADVDDSTFWHPPLAGVQPTNRRFLADLARRVADAGAVVIGLDFHLKSPSSAPGDDPIRADDNAHLLKTIRSITAKGVPVVLTHGLVDNGHGEWQQEPNIFPNETLPTRVLLGHINIPRDRREIPLNMRGRDWSGSSITSFRSFALQLVSAFEDATHIEPQTRNKPVIRAAIDRGEFVFGGFIRRAGFPAQSAQQLWRGNKDALAFCRGRIVLIGATWHAYAENRGPLVESFRSPIGTVPGCVLHANYVEALLDDRFNRVVPAWLAVLVDLLLAIWLYYAYTKTSRQRRLLLLLLFCVPLIVAYVSFTNIGLYLDFMLPLGLCFLHLITEHVVEYNTLHLRA